MRRLFVLASAIVMALVCSCTGKNEACLSDSELMAQFSNPSNEWRGKPFWSWNGELEKDELIRQVGVMEDMGFGGYFMHSRVGLATEYLGDEWFDLINSTADAGTEKGMINYLYDEDRWPSGTAGGYVTMVPEYRLHKMKMAVIPKSADMQLPDTLAAAFTCHLEGSNYSDLQRFNTVEEAMAAPGETVLAFYVREADRSFFYNGYTMVDGMNREATDYYIELTHDKYQEKCGSRIGTTITGIFTDEPFRGSLFPGHKINDSEMPWTAKMPQYYQERFGGDMLDKLPAIFLHPDGATYDRAKWEYVELAQELFLENFVEPQHQWCLDHGIAYTGHYLHEDNLTSQVVNQGSLMRTYEHQDIPGIDNLTQYSRTYWAAKQLSSVAHQIGKKMLLSELYGCSGWQMSFEDYKDAGDWEALFGINVRCPHLSWYTMKGEAKRDYPASINFQSGWYKEFKYVEDYYARLGLMMAQGNPDYDLLVISPIESVFAQASCDSFNGLSPASPSMVEIEERYYKLFGWIQGAQYDFDYADEDMMSRLCSVSTAKDGTTLLNVGQAAYKTVFVGNMATMRSTTLAILKEFAEKGGKIILAGDAPSMVDVAASDEAAAFLKSTAVCVDYSKEGIRKALAENVTRMAQLPAGMDDIFCQVRKDGDRTTYVFMNMSSEESYNDVDITLPAQGELSLWDCRTGKVTAMGAAAPMKLNFPPLQEYVYVVSKNAVGDAPEAVAEISVVSDKQEYEYALNELNVLPVDMCTFKANGLVCNTPTEILLADRKIRKHFGLNYRGGSMLQPWFFKKFVGDKKPSYGEVELNFKFNIDVMPADAMFICIEAPQDFQVKVNGSVIATETEEWWIDPCYRKIALDKSLLKTGVNEVTLVTDFTEDKNLESMFVVGNFGVTANGTRLAIDKLPATLKLGDIVPQGLPYYSGTVSYNAGPVNASAIKVDSFGGACVKARKGDKWNMIAFAPYIQAIPEGEGDLWLDVVLTRRNTFGPLHHAEAKSWAYGPENFVVEGDAYTDNYVTLPAGLLAAPVFSAE